MGTDEQNVAKQKGGISGTPEYLAPEILKKQEIGMSLTLIFLIEKARGLIGGLWV